MLVKEYLLSISKIQNDNKILLHNLYNNNSILGNNICNENFYNDIHIFNSNNIYEKINNNKSDLGSIHLQYKLCNPINNIDELKENQKIIKEFMLLDRVYNFEIINKNIENILWFYKDRTDEEKVLLNNLNFKNKYLKFITNKYSFMLLYYGYRYYVSPIFVIVYPLLILIVPFMLMRLIFKMKIKINIFYQLVKKMYLPKFDKSKGFKGKLSFIGSLLFSLYGYLNGIYNEYKIIKNINNTIKILHGHLQSVLNTINFYIDIIKDNIIKNLKNVNLEKFKFLSKRSLTNNENYFSNKAYIYHSYNKFLKIKEEFINVLYNIGIIESYYNISIKINNKKYCLTNYIENTKTPYIEFNDMWHPLINNNIKNRIIQGGKNKKSYIITGPNGGGKSTYLRCIALNILFSQTFGFGFSRSGYITPYSHIDTYMFIPDKEGYESLFQAEISRCKSIIDNIDNNFYYLIVDEIFNSTNPIEGISCSHSFIELLNNYKNILGIYSTHYNYVTNLSKKINNIGNIKVNVNRVNGKIKFPYKIEEGISKDYIALELIKEKGFNNKFIGNAIELKNKLYSEFNF